MRLCGGLNVGVRVLQVCRGSYCFVYELGQTEQKEVDVNYLFASARAHD